MEDSTAYETYANCLAEIIELLHAAEASQKQAAQEERSAVSAMEDQYLRRWEALQQARRTVQAQYESVWESCTRNTGLRRPRDQRPAAADLPWQEAVRRQEQAAAAIRNWFSARTQQAFAERQKRLQAEAKNHAAMAAAQAETQKKRAEEAARAEEERAETLIEALKRKYRER